MPKYIAFLRAINVGGRIVRMEHLRRLFETMRFSEVETFIASGNVIFDSPSRSPKQLESVIEEFLLENLGFTVTTFIRSTAELAKVARYKPFADAELNAEGTTLYIGFLAHAPGAEAKRKLLSLNSEVDELHLNGRELYWLCSAKFSESQLSGARLEKTLGMKTTLRNSTTVKRMAAKYS
jgi:uncharacterized protein (DUF1697 family)